MLRPSSIPTVSALLLTACLVWAPLPASAAPVVPEYTIGDLYAAARTFKEIRFGKTFNDHAIIKSSPYQLDREQVRYFFFHEVYGPRIAQVLKEDDLVDFKGLDRFLRSNLGRLHHASFYSEGFILLQLENPTAVVIVPVSLVTVQRSEREVRAYLKVPQ